MDGSPKKFTKSQGKNGLRKIFEVTFGHDSDWLRAESKVGKAHIIFLIFNTQCSTLRYEGVYRTYLPPTNVIYDVTISSEGGRYFGILVRVYQHCEYKNA